MTKRRRVNKKRLLIVILVPLIIIGLIVTGIIILIPKNTDTKNEYVVSYDVDYSDIETLDLDLHSKAYLLIRLNDFKALYGEKYNSVIYPASLTKVLAMDTCVNRVSNLEDISYVTQDQYNELIYENASLAGIVPYKEYSIKDLLYYLVLPSGADAAVAISNYFESKGMNLVDEMNKRCVELGLEKSNFTNPIGLHNDNMYTTLKDLSLIYIDAIKNDVAKDILKTSYSEEYRLYSTIYPVADRDDRITVFGGKTGYTDEAHQNIIVFYEVDNRSYILLLAGAPGNPGLGEHYHYDDVNLILDYLYN